MKNSSRSFQIILFPNRELRIPAKVLIAFIVPRLSHEDSKKSPSPIDLFQPNYEQMISQALHSIDQNGITSLAMPLLEPNSNTLRSSSVRHFCLFSYFSAKGSSNRRIANKMGVRAMISALRQFSQNSSAKLKRFIIVDHQVQIQRMSRRVKKYQKQVQTKISIGNNIDLDNDDGHAFAEVFGVPQSVMPVPNSSGSDSEEEVEPEEYILPYIDQARS